MCHVSSSLAGCGLFLLLTLTPRHCQADQPPAKPASKQAQAELRQYLPVLLQKTLLENDRELVRDVEKLIPLCELILAGNVIVEAEKEEAERQLLQDRIRVVDREAAYRDALDEYSNRFDVPDERLRLWEDSTVRPLLRQLQAYEALYSDAQTARDPLEQGTDWRDAKTVRALVEKVITSSKLTAGSGFLKPFSQTWKTWRQVKDVRKAYDDLSEKRDRLREKQREKYREGKQLTAEEKEQYGDIVFEFDVARLELALRHYEEEPWKEVAGQRGRESLRRAVFRAVLRTVTGLLNYPYGERLERLEKSWPDLPPTRIDKVDLLTCTSDRAEKIVATQLKDRAAVLAGKSRARKLRAAAQRYRLQQRAAAVLWSQRAHRREQFLHPGDRSSGGPGGEGAAEQLFVGAEREAFLPLLEAYHGLARAKADLIRTWLGYQQLRLELYESLELPLP